MLLETAFVCYALAVYWEGRSEPEPEARRQIVHVIKNRVHHSGWPDDACSVVKQKNQFSFFWDGKSDRPRDRRAWEQSMQDVRDAFDAPWENFGATHYVASYIPKPAWASSPKMRELGQLGTHVFYLETSR